MPPPWEPDVGVVKHYSATRLRCPYSGLSELNTLDVYLPFPRPPPSNTAEYWIIYIHGGAWRDPLVRSSSIHATLDWLDPAHHPIAGVASVDYRLSPYTSHPEYPSGPSDGSRNAVHPTHVQDVMTAIGWLQRTYGFGERYVLVGHSCGATIAFQTVMGLWSAPPDHVGNAAVSKPVAIVGVAGIYNLGLLASTYETVPVYRDFLEGAFGQDRREWLKADPTSGDYERTWPNAKAVVLGWSKDDSLVDETQVQCMSSTLLNNPQVGRSERFLQLTGEHDEIWRNGQYMAATITTALAMLNADTAYLNSVALS